ncbi:MAG: L-rhamnose mutarotase [Saprospiraceae bacterium]|nr:L-rhamnose mutarotase [Saprospiraceae bacterium]
MAKKYALLLDLKNDPHLIAEYEKYHQNVPDEIVKSIKDSGIISLDIYRWENRLFMTLVTEDDFSFERKKQMDEANPHVLRWEELMWNYQQALPGVETGEKWQLMQRICEL